ncbi:hypothetical protein [Amycolatopsis sp. NPDC051128]|uniref:hypothetical protein n=1 Tax=Amycolatopsis sp. NPDC051128 TaxID=3155412 RepID=UPI003413498E
MINPGTRHASPSHAEQAVRRAIERSAEHRMAGIRTRAPTPARPSVPPSPRESHRRSGNRPRLVLGTHRIGGLYATGGDIAAEVLKPLPEAKPRLSQPPAWHLNHVLATGRKNP